MKKLQNLFISLYFFLILMIQVSVGFYLFELPKVDFWKKKNIFLLVFSLYMLCLSLGKVVQQWIFVIVYLYIYIYILPANFSVVITNGLYCLITSGQIMVPPKRIYPQICPQHREFINTFHQKIQKTANHFL